MLSFRFWRFHSFLLYIFLVGELARTYYFKLLCIKEILVFWLQKRQTKFVSNLIRKNGILLDHFLDTQWFSHWSGLQGFNARNILSLKFEVHFTLGGGWLSNWFSSNCLGCKFFFILVYFSFSSLMVWNTVSCVLKEKNWEISLIVASFTTW